MKKQLRKLKLWELGIGEWPYQISYEKVKDIVDRNINGSDMKTSNKYPESYFLIKENNIIVRFDKKHTWVRKTDLWSILQDEFLLEYEDVQAVMKLLLEKHFKSKVRKPHILYSHNAFMYEQHFHMNEFLSNHMIQDFS